MGPVSSVEIFFGVAIR